ncbi:MAG: hypothetical protein U1E62_23810 [Alsobacter sp.]
MQVPARAGPSLMLPLGLLVGAAGGILAFLVLGGPGVALLGLGVLFVAVRLDLEQDGPVGGDRNETLFALGVSRRSRGSLEDRVAGLADALAFTRLNVWAQIAGAVLLMTGLALWRWGP